MENMDAIIEFISALIEKGFAYESEGDVYYRTRKFEGYGKLSHQSIDELRVGARIEIGEKNKMHLILPFGKRPRMMKYHGRARGVRGVLAGISNAPQWLKSIWGYHRYSCRRSRSGISAS